MCVCFVVVVVVVVVVFCFFCFLFCFVLFCFSLLSLFFSRKRNDDDRVTLFPRTVRLKELPLNNQIISCVKVNPLPNLC